MSAGQKSMLSLSTSHPQPLAAVSKSAYGLRNTNVRLAAHSWFEVAYVDSLIVCVADAYVDLCIIHHRWVLYVCMYAYDCVAASYDGCQIGVGASGALRSVRTH